METKEVSIFQSANYQGIEYNKNEDRHFHIKTCGLEQCLPGYEYPHAAREGYHLHVVISGKGTLTYGGQTHEVHAGQMFLLKSRTDIAYRADDIDPWYYVWVWYGGDLAGMYMEWAGFTDDVLVLDCHVDPMEFMTVVKEMLERPRLELSSELFRKGQAFRFLSLAVLSHEKATQNQHKREDLTVDDYVDYAVKYIRANYSHLRIADVAEYIGISRSYFTEIFHRKMLMSPQEYLMQVRMNRARELLEETQLSVAVVAGSVGYEDQLAFSKIFRKKTGMSPEQYRKKQRNEHSL